MRGLETLCRGPEATAAVARALAALLEPGDVVLLEGGLASGKTWFVKALAAALGARDPVTSPSFAIAQAYEISGGTLVHVDAWRLSGADAYHALGLEDHFVKAITVVEWGGRVAAAFTDALVIRFDPGEPDEDDTRCLVLSASGGRAAVILEQFRAVATDGPLMAGSGGWLPEPRPAGPEEPWT